MLTILKGYIKEKYQKQGEAYLGLVHRLDRPVGGVMAFARTSKAAGRLSEQIRERSVEKIYYAVLSGMPPDMSGRLEHRLIKESAGNIVRVHDISGVDTGANTGVDTGANTGVDTGANTGANTGVGMGAAADITDKNYAALEYCVLERKEGMALVSVKLLTGRPHQIRAQFAHVGCPVAGDRKYGKDHAVGGDRQIQPALWAASFGFRHPVNRSPVVVSAPPPDEYPWKIFNFERK